MDRDDGPAWVEIVADRKIREAMEEGRFENLPGKGRPLNLETYSRLPAELRAAHRLMKEANILPDWIELSRSIRTAEEKWERRREQFLSRRRNMRAPDPVREQPACARMDRLRTAFLSDMAKDLASINRDIDKLNLIAPSPAQGRCRLPMVRMMEQLEAELPPLLAAETAGPAPWREELRPAGPVRLSNIVLPRRRGEF